MRGGRGEFELDGTSRIPWPFSRDHNLEAFMRKGRVYLDYRNN
jgi:hypothetical protein